MTTINLYNSSSQNEGGKNSRAIDSGFFLSIAILVIVLGAWAFSEFYIRSLEKQNTQLQAEIDGERMNGLSGERVNGAADLQVRLNEIKSNNENKKVNDILSAVSKAIVAGTSINEFKYDSKELKLTVRTDSFLTLARQTMSFKKSSDFSDVSIANISRVDNNIVFDVTMKLTTKEVAKK